MAVRCSAPAVWRVSSELKTQQTFGSVCNRAAKGERQREIETEKEKDESSSVNPSTRVSHDFSCRRAWTREPYTTSSPPPTTHHANAGELDVPRVAVGMSSREGCPAVRQQSIKSHLSAWRRLQYCQATFLQHSHSLSGLSSSEIEVQPVPATLEQMLMSPLNQKITR